jgi:hypothetical protein
LEVVEMALDSSSLHHLLEMPEPIACPEMLLEAYERSRGVYSTLD